jgi:hypothetical protein
MKVKPLMVAGDEFDDDGVDELEGMGRWFKGAMAHRPRRVAGR